MPLTPEQIQSFATQRLGLEAEAERGRRRTQQDYDIGSRLTQEQSTREQGNVADQLASQGLYQSGIRINEQGQVVRRANETLSNLDLTRTRGLEDITGGLTRGLTGVAESERNAVAEAGRRDREEAIQRALLEAQRAEPVVQPPAYPNPVIPYTPPPDPFGAYMASLQARQIADAQAGATISQRFNTPQNAAYYRQHAAANTSAPGYYAHGFSYAPPRASAPAGSNWSRRI